MSANHMASEFSDRLTKTETVTKVFESIVFCNYLNLGGGGLRNNSLPIIYYGEMCVMINVELS